jgi:type IV pilus assembly protein PilX
MKRHPYSWPADLTRPQIPRSSQRGVSLVFALIAVLVMLIAAVAVVRSFNTSLFQAGNLAFKRDLTNQSERAMDLVFERMRTGNLATETQRAGNVQAANYSAAILGVNAQGIPNALLSDSAFAGVGVPANDIALTDANNTEFGQVRYVVERLCNQAGDAGTLGPSGCIFAQSVMGQATSSSELIRADRTTTGGGGGSGASSQQVVYRVTIRVTGPRNTQGFYQSTFAR